MWKLPYGLPFLNGWPFKQIWYSFEQLRLSVPKKKSVICLNGLGYLFEKKCHLFEWFVLSVRTAWAIRLKKMVIGLNKIVICSNCYVNLFKKEIVDCSSNWSYIWTILSPAIRVERSVILEWSRYEVCLQTYHEYCHGSLCSFVAIFAFILSFDDRQYRHTLYSILRNFFQQVSRK